MSNPTLAQLQIVYGPGVTYTPAYLITLGTQIVMTLPPLDCSPVVAICTDNRTVHLQLENGESYTLGENETLLTYRV